MIEWELPADNRGQLGWFQESELLGSIPPSSRTSLWDAVNSISVVNLPEKVGCNPARSNACCSAGITERIDELWAASAAILQVCAKVLYVT